MGQPLVNKGAIQVAKVNKACRAWTESGNLSSLCEIAMRIHGLIVSIISNLRINEFAEFN